MTKPKSEQFKAKVSEIFPRAAGYIESPKLNIAEFEVQYQDITYADLQRLAKVMGTNNISIHAEGYGFQDSYGVDVEYTITVNEVQF